MVKAFTVLLMIALALLILICVIFARAADYDPAWADTEWERTDKAGEEVCHDDD